MNKSKYIYIVENDKTKIAFLSFKLAYEEANAACNHYFFSPNECWEYMERNNTNRTGVSEDTNCNPITLERIKLG